MNEAGPDGPAFFVCMAMAYTGHMQNQNECDLVAPSASVPKKKTEIVDGYLIKYHANGTTRWSKGKMSGEEPDGYWEWYRPDGTLKRSGHFDKGKPVGEWVTYGQDGKPYKTSDRG